jgi:hypothetical protein
MHVHIILCRGGFVKRFSFDFSGISGSAGFFLEPRSSAVTLAGKRDFAGKGELRKLLVGTKGSAGGELCLLGVIDSACLSVHAEG